MEGNRRNGKKTEKTIQRKISKGRSADSNLLFASGGIYVALLVFHTGNQVHASELLQLQLYYAGTVQNLSDLIILCGCFTIRIS